MGRHAAPTRTARVRTSLVVSALPLVLLGATGAAYASVADAAPAEATAVVTPAADGSVPNVPAPDGYRPGD
jgi:hypothetical protein